MVDLTQQTPGAVSPVFNVPLQLGPTSDLNVNSPRAVSNTPGKFIETDGKHQGIAGTARDILGTLGDFLLTRLHLPAMYAPAQKNRRLEEALSGYNDNPSDAISQATAVDPVFGAKLRDQYIDNQRLAAQQESTVEARNARLAAAKQVQDDRTRNRAAAMLNTMSQWAPDKKTAGYGMLRDQILKYGQANGLDLSSELPTSYDPDQISAFNSASVPVSVQNAQEITKDKNEGTADYRNKRLDLTEKLAMVRDARSAAGQGITASHNAATEGIAGGRLAETVRHDQTSEGQRGASLGEKTRHNTVVEQQGAARLAAKGPVEGEVRIVNGKKYQWKGGKPVAL